MKFETLNETEIPTVAVIFGRFNPPHAGHKGAWEVAKQVGTAGWYVGTNPNTQGAKGKSGPLPRQAADCLLHHKLSQRQTGGQVRPPGRDGRQFKSGTAGLGTRRRAAGPGASAGKASPCLWTQMGSRTR